MTTRPSSPPAQDASIPLPPTVRTITRREKRKMQRVGKNSTGKKDARIGICLCTERESQRGIERERNRERERERETEREIERERERDRGRQRERDKEKKSGDIAKRLR